MKNDAYGKAVAQAQSAIADAPARLQSSADIAIQALALLHDEMPATFRGALLAVESLLGDSLALNVWQYHLRNDHERATQVLEVAGRVQRAVTTLLGETR